MTDRTKAEKIFPSMTEKPKKPFHTEARPQPEKLNVENIRQNIMWELSDS